MKTKWLLWGVVASAMVASCGGGGDAEPEILTGVLRAGRVQGLAYRTETLSGVTDAQGSFKYVAGEQVTFSVGEVVLGTGPGSPELTLFQVVRLAPPTYEPLLRRELTRMQTTHTVLSRAANVAWLLLALDADADPANGLDVRGHEQLKRDSVDFDVPLRDFPRQLATLAPDLNNNIPPSEPLIHLYRSAGIKLKASIPTSQRWDADSDGIDEYRLVGEYGSDGLISRTTTDLGADGTVDVISNYGWGKFGRQTSFTAEPTPASTSTLSLSRTYGFDLRGNLESFIMRDADPSLPIFPPERRVGSTFDRYGRILSQTEDSCSLDCATIFSRETSTLTRDGNGNAELEVRAQDWDFDGEPDSITRIVSKFDDAGRVDTVVMTPENAAGEAQSRYTQDYAYDANGRVSDLVATSDFEDDGEIDYRTTNHYDYRPDGLVSHQLYEIELVPGGVVYRSEVDYEFDTDRRPLSVVELVDVDVNGAPDYRYTQTSDYDETGLRRKWESTSEYLGGLDLANYSSVDTEYGEDGAPDTEITRQDFDGDGIFESTETNAIGYEPSEDAIAQVVTMYF